MDDIPAAIKPTTMQDLEVALVNADQAGDTQAATALANELIRLRSNQKIPGGREAPQRSEAYQAGQALNNSPMGSWAQGALTTVQGPTFGFGDELLGAGYANIASLTGQPWKESYEQGRDFVRGGVDRFTRDNPLTSAGSQILSTLPLGGVMSRPFGVAASTAGQVGRTAALGAVEGGMQGAGNNVDPGQILGDITRGAVTGGALSGVTGAAVPAVSNVVRNTRARIPTGSRVGNALEGGSGVDEARRQVAVSMLRDETDPGRMAARLAKLGPDARIVDAGGQNTARLLDVNASMPGRTPNLTEQAIRDRQVTRPQRLRESASENLAGGKQFEPVYESLTNRQQTVSSPIYGELEQLPIVGSTALKGILTRPVIQDALKQANVNRLNRELPPILDANGNMVSMDFRAWNDVKKGLDDVINQIKRSPNASNEAKSTLSDALDTKKLLVTEINRQTGGKYREALDAWAGPAAMKDAMEDGLAAWTKTPMQLRQAMRDMSESEKESFRLGFFQAMQDKVGTRAGQNQLLAMSFEPTTRERLMAIFPDTRSYRQFASTVLAEQSKKRLEQAGRGSQTASRLFSEADMAGDVASMGANVVSATQGSPGAMANVLRQGTSLYNRMLTPEPVRDQIGRILLLRGGQSDLELNALKKALAQLRQERMRDTAVSAILGNEIAASK